MGSLYKQRNHVKGSVATIGVVVAPFFHNTNNIGQQNIFVKTLPNHHNMFDRSLPPSPSTEVVTPAATIQITKLTSSFACKISNSFSLFSTLRHEIIAEKSNMKRIVEECISGKPIYLNKSSKKLTTK